jgi:GNAT superfamily N-acetyltransferase
MQDRSNTPLTIRQPTRTERDEVVRLLAIQLQEHDVEIATDTLTRAIDGVFDRPERGLLMIAATEEKPIGVAYLSFQWTLEYGGPIAWLEELYISPEHREKGIGTKLLNAVIEELQKRGYLALDLEIEKGHERVASLYLRSGFKQLTRVRYAKKLNV